MNSKRRALLATILATSTAMPVNAGCFDWLFRKQPTTPPFAVGFAPQTTITPLGPPVPVGAPVMTVPHVVGFAPQTSAFAPQTSAFAPHAAGFAPSLAGLAPAVAAQAPAYSAGFAPFGTAFPVDNPSVLTGRPVVQTSAMQPSSGPFPGMPFGSAALPPAAMTPPPQPSGFGSWFGKAIGNDYQTSYFGAPTTTYRPVTQIDPTTGAVVTVQQPCTSITQQVQRSPYSSLQPATAPTVPYSGEPTCGSEPPRYAPPTSYDTGYGTQSAYAPQTGYPPAGAYPQQSGISQATAITPNGISPNGVYGAPAYASPIPTTSPYAGAMPYQQQTTQPLSGYPGTQPNDMAPLAAPQLDSMRPAWPSTETPPATFTPSTSYPPSGSFNVPANGLPAVPPSAYPSTTNPPTTYPSSSYPPSSYPSTGGTLEAPPLPATSAWPERREVRSDENVAGAKSLAQRIEDKYSDIPPIPAANDYQAPAWSEAYSRQNATPVDTGRDRFGDRIPTGVSLSEPRTASRDAAPMPNPVSPSASDSSWRYASVPGGQAASQMQALPPLPPAPASQPATKRDDSGWFVIEPR